MFISFYFLKSCNIFFYQPFIWKITPTLNPKGKLVFLMMIVSDSGSYAEALVNELFV